ncbi:MAG: RagB/SusD family nutrient uptake outer membrane protein, partial [Tannerellaceae bacterium]
MKKIIILSIAATLTFGACNDDFLEKAPVESQTETTAFMTYDNFKTYAWSLYSTFDNAEKINGVDNKDKFIQSIISNMGRYEGDFRAGYLSIYETTEPNELRNQTATVPSNGGGWDFRYVRMINLMIDNLDKSEMTDAEKAHWRSVGYFFHEFNYM